MPPPERTFENVYAGTGSNAARALDGGEI